MELTYAELEYNHNGENCPNRVSGQPFERLLQVDQQRDKHEREPHLGGEDNLPGVGPPHLHGLGGHILQLPPQAHDSVAETAVRAAAECLIIPGLDVAEIYLRTAFHGEQLLPQRPHFRGHFQPNEPAGTKDAAEEVRWGCGLRIE